MSHKIELGDQAFQAYERRARRLGMSVDEYLEQSAPAPDDGFHLTPEMRAGIERGLADVEAGRTHGLSEVRETLAKYRAAWQEENRA